MLKHQWDYENSTSGGKTSVKIHNVPGGASSINLGWDEGPSVMVVGSGGGNIPMRNHNNSILQQQSSYQRQQQRINNGENSLSPKQRGYEENSSPYKYGRQVSDNMIGKYGQGNAQGSFISAVSLNNEESIYNHQKQGQLSGLRRSPYHSSSTAEIAPPMHQDSGDNRTSVKVHNPPGGKSSLNLGGYGGEEEGAGPGKIGARSMRPVAIQHAKSALRQYDMNLPAAGLRGSNNGSLPPQANNNAYSTNQNAYPLVAPRGNQNQLSPQLVGNKAYGFHSSGGTNQQVQNILGGNQNSYQVQQYNGGYQSQPYINSNGAPSPPQHRQFVANSGEQIIFGQRITSGMNSGPTTDKSSVKLHAPPGGKSNFQFY